MNKLSFIESIKVISVLMKKPCIKFESINNVKINFLSKLVNVYHIILSNLYKKVWMYPYYL